MNSRNLWLGLVMLVAQTANAASGVLLRNEVLRENASADAAPIAQLARGASVEILRRTGGWVRVQAGGREGWLRVFSLRGSNEEAPAVGFWGRIKSVFLPGGGDARGIVAVAGLRGIDSTQGVAARDVAVTRALDVYRPGPAEVAAFAQAGELNPQQLAYLDPPGQDDAGLVRWLKRGGGAASESPALSLHGALLLGKATPADEQRIGAHIASQIERKAPLVREAAVQRYVNQVGGWLVMQSEKPEQPWRFGVLDSDEIFTVSAPGGFVFLTRGLYQRLESEAELAAVLGSEMAQVLRHQPMLYLKEIAQTLAAPEVAESAADSAASGTLFLIDLIGDAGDYLSRNLDPQGVFAADRAGLVLAVRAGYEPYAFASVLQKLDSIGRDDPSLVLFSRTRPSPSARLQQLAAAMDAGVGSSRFDSFTAQSQANRFRQFALPADRQGRQERNQQ